MLTTDLDIMADLEALTNDELRGVIAKSNEILDGRDKQRKKEALDHARAIMAEAGLPFPIDSAKPKRKRRAAGRGA